MSDDDLIRRGDALDAVAAAIGKSGGNDEFGNMMQEVILQNEDDQGAIRAIPAVTPGVRVKPTDAQVASACMSYRHDFGLLDGLERTLVLHQAREWLHAWQKELDLTPQPAPTGTTAVSYHAPIRVCPICDIADCATHRPQPAPDVAGVVEAAKAYVDAHDKAQFMRSADYHNDDCSCLRCHMDRLRAAIAAMEGKV